MKYNELMVAFAAKYGLPAIEPKDGAVVLEFNGIPMAFMENEAIDSILLRSVIGAPPPDADGSLNKKILRENYSLCTACGATLCQDPESKEYVAVLTIPLRVANEELLAKAVGKMVATVETWKAILASDNSEQYMQV